MSEYRGSPTRCAVIPTQLCNPEAMIRRLGQYYLAQKLESSVCCQTLGLYRDSGAIDVYLSCISQPVYSKVSATPVHAVCEYGIAFVLLVVSR